MKRRSWELTRKIAYRDGFGDILADHPVEAGRKLGRNDILSASHTKGQAAWVPGHGIGITLIYTLSLNVNSRGYDHLMGGMSILTPDLREEWGITRELLERLGEERYGDPAIFRDNKWAYHPQIVQAECDFEHMMVMADMAGTCKFATQYNQPVEGIDFPEWSGFLSAATGESFTDASLQDAARRIITLERCYNAREGVRRPDDYPFFLWWQKKFGEPHPGCTPERRRRSRRRSTTGFGRVVRSARLRPAERHPDRGGTHALRAGGCGRGLKKRGVLPGDRHHCRNRRVGKRPSHARRLVQTVSPKLTPDDRVDGWRTV